MGKAMELRGERFGELVVERLLRTEPQRGRVWLCLCDCGNEAHRTSSQLMRSRYEHQEPCCRDCFVELRAGRRHERRARNSEFFLSLYEETGDLYTPGAEQRMTREVRDAVAEEMGFFPEPEFEHAPEAFLWEPPPGPTSRFDCTLEKIGGQFGVQRERVRQIEAKALRRMRHPERSSLLRPFFDEEPVRLCSEPEPTEEVVTTTHRWRTREPDPVDAEAAKKRHVEWLDHKREREQRELDEQHQLRKRSWLRWFSAPKLHPNPSCDCGCQMLETRNEQKSQIEQLQKRVDEVRRELAAEELSETRVDGEHRDATVWGGEQ